MCVQHPRLLILDPESKFDGLFLQPAKRKEGENWLEL